MSDPIVGRIYSDGAAPLRTAHLNAVRRHEHCDSCTCSPWVSITYVTDSSGEPCNLLSVMPVPEFIERFTLIRETDHA